MGLFDFLRRRPSSEPTPEAPASPAPAAPAEGASDGPEATALPPTPFKATISAFAAGDGLGSLTLENGSRLRFGASACKGFEPVVGIEVEVAATAPHPLGGLRATEVRLSSDTETYDLLLSQHDHEPDHEHSVISPVEEAAAASQVLGWIVVLLDEAPPLAPGAFGEWAQRLGLPAAGIRVRTEGGFALGVGGTEALVYVGDEPFPRERLADLGAPDGFPAGGGFLCLSLGLPGTLPLLRAGGQPCDPWGPGGGLRDLSTLALELSKHGPAVILPQAGAMLLAKTFRDRLGDLGDPQSRPFGAWMGFAVDRQLGVYSSYGMVLHGLPDVTVQVDASDDWALDRAREAILVACSRMVHENRELAPGEKLEVPVGQPIGSAPLEPTEGDCLAYEVARMQQDPPGAFEAELDNGPSGASGSLHLRRLEGPDARDGWAVAPGEGQARLAFNTYRELLRHSLSRALDAERLTGLSPDVPAGAPPFEIDVWESRDESGFFMASNGIGRVRQQFGEAEDGTEHVELVAAMPAHHPLLANALAAVAGQVHLQKSAHELFKPGDTVGLALPEIRAAGFVLADAGTLAIARGPRIHLLELVPVSQAEYAQARELGSAGLLKRLGPMAPASRAARWKLTLS